MFKFVSYSLLILYIILSVGCTANRGENSQLAPTRAADSIPAPPPLQIGYFIDSIRNDSALKALKAKYTPEQWLIIGALNRINPERIRAGKPFVMPDTLMPDLMDYSPFPVSYPAFDSIAKLILVAKRIQAFAAYENGKLVRWGPVSTGRKSKPTPSGLFHTNYKAKLKISTVDGSWRMPWYFNISNRGGIGMHQYVLPGYPASHSCIRMFQQDAYWNFHWADTWTLNQDETIVLKPGTPVIVFGEFDFSGIPAWKEVVENTETLQLTEEEIKALEEYTEKNER